MNETLVHHGILGQKWGVRRYQNEDGSLTALGKKHVGQKTTAEKRTEAAQKQDAAKKAQANLDALKARDSYNREALEGRKRTEAAQKQDEAIRVAARGRTDDEEEELEKARAKQKLKALEKSLVDTFGESESLKYVKTNRDDDPRKTTFTYVSPIDGSKSIFTLSMASSLVSRLKGDLETASNAKKRTEAAKKQTEAIKKQEIVQRKDTLKSQVKNFTTSGKRNEAAHKQTEANAITVRDKAAANVRKERDKLAAQVKKLEQSIESAPKSSKTTILTDYGLLASAREKLNALNVKLSKLEKQNGYKKLRHGDQMNNILVHYGVLGMKWGIRRRTAGQNSRSHFNGR